jgi:hypothetical protein
MGYSQESSIGQSSYQNQSGYQGQLPSKQQNEAYFARKNLENESRPE